MAREVDAITRLYDYLLWVVPKLEKFPKSQKFLLADRIENLLLDILELLIEASYSRKKDRPLEAANIKLEKVRYLIRLAKDMQLLNLKSYENSARMLHEIGTSVGGWLKYSRK